MPTFAQEARAFKFGKGRKKQADFKVEYKPKVSESAVVDACFKWLCAYNLNPERHNTGAHKTEAGSWLRYGTPGSGDIYVVIEPYGRHCEIECKSSTGELSEKQLARREKCRREGSLYIVARSVDDLEAQKRHLLGLAVWTPEGWR
jgi:hypothetical protein